MNCIGDTRKPLLVLKEAQYYCSIHRLMLNSSQIYPSHEVNHGCESSDRARTSVISLKPAGVLFCV